MYASQSVFERRANEGYKQYQVTKLCGIEPLTKYVVLGVVLLQLICA